MQDQAMALSRRFLGLSADKRRLFLEKLAQQGMSPAALPMPSGVAGETSPASYAQQRLWFIEQMTPGNSAYHLPGALALDGPVDEQALHAAFQALAQRHASLRTTFSADDSGQPLQHVRADINVSMASWQVVDDDVRAQRLQAFVESPFDWEQGPLWRVALVEQAPQQYQLWLCVHHVIADGWSIQVLLQDFAQAYQQVLAGAEHALGELDVDYADYALWQRALLEAGAGQEDLDYWRQQLGETPPVLDLPWDHPRPAHPEMRGGRRHFHWSQALSQTIQQQAQQAGTTAFTVLLSAFKVWLYRMSGQPDLAVGVPMAGRDQAELAPLIGFFVNTQVLRDQFTPAHTFQHVLAQVNATSQAAQAHQMLPFEHLVEHLQPERSLNHNPLFQVLYNHQQREQESLQLTPELTATLLPHEAGNAQFDLALHTWTLPSGEIGGNWHYAADLLDADTIDRWHTLFEQLLTQLLAEPDRPIGDIALISPAERQQLAQWNDTAVSNASDDESPEALTTLVPRRFEQQVQAHPDRIALTVWPPEGTPTQLSYAELDRQANALAHELIARGVQPEDTVAVAMERSVALVVALYAIIKAGAAYVPVDPAHPQARQQRVIEQSGTRYLLAHQMVDMADYEAMVPARVTVLHWASLDLSARPTTVPDVTLHPQQQAYVIFTSGSTGLPKGVANTHDALLNRLQWMQQVYPLSAEDKVLQKTPYSFDVSVWEFFWPLMVGAELVVAAPGAHQDPAQLHQVIEQSGISVLHFVPSMLSAFVNHLTTDSSTPDLTPSCPSLKHVICSGEALPKPLQTLTLAQLPHIQLHNLYGPTEAAIDVTHWTCQPDDPRAQVPIGRPITRLQIHILDPQLNPQPIGVPGELYIGGIGLARGYHGQPGLTAERFIPNPFIQNSSSDTASSAAGERLYRTGDLARWCADGTLEYLGRLDHQIKLRGLRIELGEIEAVMASFPGVTESVVVARDDQLVGYVAPKLGLTEQGLTEQDLTALRQHLEAQLPSYMVPTHLMALDELPLSANGKLDRNALPEPVRQEAAFEAPEGPIETTLAALWAGVLHLEAPVGRQDNFFALGGHSLLGVTLVHQIEATFGITLSLGALFETHTLADLAAYIAHCDTALPALKPRPKPEYAVQAPQSFAQQRLWFLAQLTPDSVAYHLPAGLSLSGALDPDALQRALDRLVAHHEILRTCFMPGDLSRDAGLARGEASHEAKALPQQQILPDFRMPLVHATVTPEAFEAYQAEVMQTPFDLEAAPPWRAHLVRLSDDQGADSAEWRLLLCVHHILADGWSLQRFLTAWVAAYREELLVFEERAGREEPKNDAAASTRWPAISRQADLSYADYALWQRTQLDVLLQDQLAWWRTTLNDEAPVLALPMDRPRPAERDGRGARYGFELPSTLAERLRHRAKAHRVSLFTLILAGFEAWLYRVTGQVDLRVGVPVAGRDQPGTAEIMGCFVNTLVLRTEVTGALTGTDLLQQVQQQMSGAQAHADLPFEQLVEALQPERSLSVNPLFQVSYNHQVLDQSALSQLPGVTARPLACPAEQAHFDLVLGTQEDDTGQLTGYLDYATDILEADTVARMGAQIMAILTQFSETLETPLHQLALLSEADQAIWQQWNTPCADSADEGRHLGNETRHSDHEHPALDPRPLYAQIQAQAQRRPEAVALVEMAPSADSRAITFAQLTERANRLAHWLIAQGVQPECRVGVALNRGIDLFVTLLAVHQAGGAYVPLDPDYPLERLSYMLNDAGAALLLTHTPTAELMRDLSVSRQVNLDTLNLADQPTTAPDVPYHPQQLAYLIYTSGSTGQPKGVAVAQGDLAMHCQTIGARYQLTPDDRELHFLSISFDGAHERWLTPLSYGARIVIRDQRLWSVQETYDCLIAQGITVAAFPPSYLRQLAQWAEVQGRAPGVHTYCFAGEAFSREMMQHAIEHLKPKWIINGYGPTETVVTPTLWRVAADKADFNSASAPIGDLVGVRQGYVLDSDLNLLPPGVAGELYLGGALARGYLDRPAQTAERFVPNPFRAGERLYRTGDRVRLNRAGQLEYLGRMDQQIKLRGFRIELGEIEAALAACDGVDVALAVLKEASKDTGGGSRLVAYVQPKAQGQSQDQPDVSEAMLKSEFQADLQAELRTRLPSYMMPTHWVVMAQLPTLPNGKLDRRSLPEPVVDQVVQQAPEGEQECLLAELWQALLGDVAVYRESHFFELGGDSILSLGLITQLRQAGWSLTPKDIFAAPQLSAMAAAMRPFEGHDETSPVADSQGGQVLTPIQAHFFSQQSELIETLGADAAYQVLSHWNQALLLTVKRPLTAELMTAAVEALLQQHDVLRLTFQEEAQAPHGWQGRYQRTMATESVFQVATLTDEADITPYCETVQAGLDLTQGPLVAIRLIQLPHGAQRLLMVLHHLLVDGVSWRLLLGDLARAYQQAESGLPVVLPSSSTSYQQWAHQLQRDAESGLWAHERAYWRAQTRTEDAETTAWPVTWPEGRRQQQDLVHCQWSLTPSQTEHLLRATLKYYDAGIESLLLTALTLALKDWGAIEQPHIVMESHGRDGWRDAQDVSHTVGWFTALYPLRLPKADTLLETLSRIQQHQAAVPGQGQGFGALRYYGTPEDQAALQGLDKAPLVFNYLGQFDLTQTDERFQVASESMGACIAPQAPWPHEVEINGQIHGGQLTLNCRYSDQRYPQAQMEDLLARIGDYLQQLMSRMPMARSHADKVEGGSSSSQPSTLNPLLHLGGPAKSATTLFCPHPVSGTVVGYYTLARYLPAHWSVWGMQNRQLQDRHWRDVSLEDMARDYVKALLAYQPQGPYYLVGWSMGGALVLEMAALLERLGQTVAFVGLVDGYVPGAGDAARGHDESPLPDDVAEDEWQQLMTLERHMRTLARQHRRIRPIQAPVHAWWAMQSPENNEGAEARLTAALGQPLATSVWLDTDHLGIIRHADLLSALTHRLEASGHVSPTSASFSV